MLKIIGSLLIIVSCTSAGFTHAFCIEARYKELWGIKRCISIMKSEVQYSYISLKEIFCNIRDYSGKENIAFWSALINEIEGKECKVFRNIWQENVRTYMKNSSLTKGDIEEFIKVGDTLGMVDRKQQICMLEMYLKRVEESISLLENEKNKRKKMAKSLGLVLGFFVVIILF